MRSLAVLVFVLSLLPGVGDAADTERAAELGQDTAVPQSTAPASERWRSIAAQDTLDFVVASTASLPNLLRPLELKLFLAEVEYQARCFDEALQNESRSLGLVAQQSETFQGTLRNLEVLKSSPYDLRATVSLYSGLATMMVMARFSDFTELRPLKVHLTVLHSNADRHLYALLNLRDIQLAARIERTAAP